MAVVFTNEADIMNHVVPKLQAAVDYMMKEIFNKNDSLVEQLVYAMGGGSYPRTGEFRDAWETISGGGQGDASGEFRFAPNEMSADWALGDNDAIYSRHASIIDGDDVREKMADILYEGTMGCITRPTGRNAYKVLDKWLTISQFKKIFEAGMSQAGIPWKRGSGAVSVQRIK